MNYYLKIFAFGILFILNGMIMKSQSTINSASNKATINGYQFDYSIGEMTMIRTENTGNLIITQGYLQPSKMKNNPSGQVKIDEEQTIRIYPNPTQNIIHIESQESSKGEIAFDLIDATGKSVQKITKELTIGFNKSMIDFSTLAAGSYYLMITKNNLSNMKTVSSYKIVKVN